MEVDLNVLAAHGRYLSVYDRDTLKWREIMHQNEREENGDIHQLSVAERKDAHIDQIIVTEAQDKKQFHILRHDGFLLEA
jgi:hypothetical protein